MIGKNGLSCWKEPYKSGLGVRTLGDYPDDVMIYTARLYKQRGMG
jgi:hypothetical protein